MGMARRRKCRKFPMCGAQGMIRRREGCRARRQNYLPSNVGAGGNPGVEHCDDLSVTVYAIELR